MVTGHYVATTERRYKARQYVVKDNERRLGERAVRRRFNVAGILTEHK